MRRRLPRLLRSTATALSILLGAATVLLWARSHSRGGSIVHQTVDPPNRRVNKNVLDYESGRMNFYRTTWTFEPASNLQPNLDALAATPRWQRLDTVTYTYAGRGPSMLARLGFRYRHGSRSATQVLHVRPSALYRGRVTTTELVIGGLPPLVPRAPPLPPRRPRDPPLAPPTQSPTIRNLPHLQLRPPRHPPPLPRMRHPIGAAPPA